MRKIHELKRIINNLPYLNFSDQEILLEDLQYLQSTISDARNKSNSQEIKQFLDQKLTYVKQSIQAAKSNDINPESLRMIHELYKPIFEDRKELGDGEKIDVKRELGLQFNIAELYRYELHIKSRGYDKEQVDELLVQILRDYELMFNEIVRLRAKDAPTKQKT